MKRPPSAEVGRFRTLVEEQFGLAFDDAKLPVLSEILEHRSSSRRCAGPREYLDRTFGSAGLDDELGVLAERLTVGETYFFRLQEHLRVLTDVVVPARLAARGSERTLRILSAGCSSGEEAYSVAIALREGLSDLARWDVRIHGIDLNPAALEKAAAGRYSVWSLRETPERLRERYFRRDGSFFRIDESIQQMVSFEKRNLDDAQLALWPARFDAIFCRNVLMYLSPRAARNAVARLAASLGPGGFLFLGTAETLRGLSQAFHLRHTHGAFYYQLRDDSARVASTPATTIAEPEAAMAPIASSAPALSDSWMVTIKDAAQRIQQLAGGVAPGAAPRARPRAAGTMPATAVAQARHLMQQERFVEALDLLAEVSDEAAADVDALLLRAVLLTNKDRPAEAETICQDVLRRDGLNAGAHYLMALCRERAGDSAAAVDHDQYALYLDPSFAMARLHLGLLWWRAGKTDAARRELGGALMLLEREDASRIVLFGGGFTREGLVALCRGQLRACGGEA